MGNRGSGLRLALSIFGLVATLLVVLFSRTDFGNWLGKSEYAEWSTYIEEGFEIRESKELENDFYIAERYKRFDFLSRVLKLWWKSHYGFQGE